MRNVKACQSFVRLYQAGKNRAKVLCGASAVIALALALPNQARAGNELVNPGMETGDFTGWTVYSAETWNYAIANTNGGTHSGAGPDVAHTGQYSFWVYGDYQGANQYDGMYQD